MNSSFRRIAGIAALLGLAVSACGGGSSSSSDTTAVRTRNAALISNSTLLIKAKDIMAAWGDLFVLSDSNKLMAKSYNFKDFIAGKPTKVLHGGNNPGALLADNTIVTMNQPDGSGTPTLPAGATGWVDFGSQWFGNVAVADNGAVAFKYSTYYSPPAVPSLRSPGTKFTNVAMGISHIVLLDDAGQVYIAGTTSEGQGSIPPKAEGATKYVKIFASTYSTGLIDDKGNAYIFGGELRTVAVPRLANGGTAFTDMSIFNGNAAFLDDKGAVYQAGTAFAIPMDAPSSGATKFVKVAAGAEFTAALDDAGVIHISRLRPFASYPTFSQSIAPVPIAASGDTTAIISEDGTVRQFGDGYAEPLPGNKLRVVSLGLTHGVALTETGEVASWGQGGFGQRTQPVLSNVRPFVKVVGGSTFSAGITNDGDFYSWGTISTDMRQTWTGVVDIAGGFNHVTVLDAGGHVYSLGSLSELGPQRAFGGGPLPGMFMFGLSDPPRRFRAIAANGECSAALGQLVTGPRDTDFTTWGSCNLKVKGNPDLSTAKKIAIGVEHGAAIMNDGSVVAWGSNRYGQRNVPAGLKDAVQIVAGDYHTVAIDKEGRVWAWGDNSLGQISIPDDLRMTSSELAAAAAKAATVSGATVVDTAPTVTTPPTKTDGESLVQQALAQLPPGAPADMVKDAKEAARAVYAESSKPVTVPGSLTVKSKTAITPAKAVKLLKLKGAKKPSFVPTKRASDSCTITKSSVTPKSSGVCKVTVAYTDAKGKAAKATLPLLIQL